MEERNWFVVVFFSFLFTIETQKKKQVQDEQKKGFGKGKSTKTKTLGGKRQFISPVRKDQQDEPPKK